MLIRFAILTISLLLATMVSKAQGYNSEPARIKREGVATDSTVIKYLEGRTFYSLISESCEETTIGGFMIYTHCFLKFDKGKINVAYYSNNKRMHDLKPKHFKSYPYKIDNQKILIDNSSNHKGLISLFIEMPGKRGQLLSVYSNDYPQDKSSKHDFAEMKDGQLLFNPGDYW